MIYTIAWLLMGVYFVIVEGKAIADKRRGDTLSEHVWDWFCLKPGSADTPWRMVKRWGFIIFWTWLTLHFVFGGAIV